VLASGKVRSIPPPPGPAGHGRGLASRKSPYRRPARKTSISKRATVTWRFTGTRRGKSAPKSAPPAETQAPL
jgi:hypothetical protein